MLNTTTEPTSDLIEFARMFREMTGLRDDVCLQNYVETVTYMRNISWSSGAVSSGYRPWFYQTCAEFGWYQTSRSEFQPFGSSFPVDLSIQMCADVFGESFTNATIHTNIDRKNVMFGSWNARVTNVYFTNGLIDPWRAMGVQEDLNPSSPADVIPGASHCADLLAISESDSPQMLAVKHRISYLVRIWLGDSATP